MNQTTIAGHLGADPEVRFTSSGQKVTTLRIGARTRKSKDKEETIWWKVSVWGEQFDKMIAHLKKGSPVIVFADLNKPEIFTDREGKPQVSMSATAYNISFSPFGRPEQTHHDHQSHNHSDFTHSTPSETTQGQAKSMEVFDDDEIPF
ncbi:MAG: single-stranded DNA-binding protein [Rhabdochlamydiaceae bacterium]